MVVSSDDEDEGGLARAASSSSDTDDDDDDDLDAMREDPMQPTEPARGGPRKHQAAEPAADQPKPKVQKKAGTRTVAQGAQPVQFYVAVQGTSIAFMSAA